MPNTTILKKYGYFWITFGLFLLAIIGHWMLAYYAFRAEQAAHNEPVELKQYLVEVGRDTLENWQSEFLQLMWQVAGLAFFYFYGSSQSKEGDERLEAKLDLLINEMRPELKGEINRINKKFGKQ